MIFESAQRGYNSITLPIGGAAKPSPGTRGSAMQNANAPDVIEKAIATVAEASREQTGGKWLENLTVNASPHIV